MFVVPCGISLNQLFDNLCAQVANNSALLLAIGINYRLQLLFRQFKMPVEVADFDPLALVIVTNYTRLPIFFVIVTKGTYLRFLPRCIVLYGSYLVVE